MQEEKCNECAGCKEVVEDLLALHNDVQTLTHSHNRMKEAFVKNDLGLPDYDGHRSNEKARIEEAKVLDGYKQTATKKFLEWLVVGAVAIFGAGVVEWVKTHIK